MRTQIQALFTAAALLGIGAVPARAQDTTVDSRWLAYLGCWEPIVSTNTQMCVVPVAGTSAVDLVKIEKGEVVAGERIVASGERIATTHGDCTGWQSAQWSSLGDRLYLRSENRCPNSGTRTGTGMIAMTRNGQWLYIQGATLGLETGVHVERYREAAADSLLPSEVQDALRPNITATMQARAAAATPLAIADVVEASHHVDAAIAEAWLVERRGPFTVDAKRLIALADQGVPARTIDLLVALSYPEVFAVNPATGQGERLAAEKRAAVAGNPTYAMGGLYPECSYDYLFYGYSSYYCDGLAYRFGYPFGYGFYPGDYPVTIIYTGSAGGGGGGGGGGGSHPHGQVINGQGYKEGVGATSDVTRWGEPRSNTSSGSSGTTSTPASTSTSTTTSTSSSGERTAKPRP